MSTKLFVGNLSFETTQNDLQDAFSEHGTVTDAVIIMDKITSRSRGFGFITMADQSSADAAVTALSGRQLHGRALTVNEARPREERAPSGGSGYGGGRSERRY